MNARTPGLIAALCVAGFVTWLTMGGRDATVGADASSTRTDGADTAAGPGTTTAAAEPGRCGAPVRWALVEVDPRFGIPTEEARSAIEEAAALWEKAAGRRLFVADSEAGLPIRFVYDSRQERANERVRLERAFHERDRELENRRTSLERERKRHLAEGSRYEERARRFEVALTEHNERVRAWNEAGAGSGQVAADLHEAEEALGREQAELSAQLDELRAREVRIGEEAAELAAALEDRNREADRLEREFPLTRVESGAFREVVRQDPAGRVGVGPEIRVFMFVTRQDLIDVLAHELGHALRLGHAREADAVMSPEHERESRARRAARVTPADIALLRARCP